MNSVLKIIITYLILAVVSLAASWALMTIFNYYWIIPIVFVAIDCIYSQMISLTENDSISVSMLKVSCSCLEKITDFFMGDGDSDSGGLITLFVLMLGPIIAIYLTIIALFFIAATIISPVTYIIFVINDY